MLTPCDARRRVPSGQASVSHRALYLPRHVFDHPVQRAAVHPVLVRRPPRVVRFLTVLPDKVRCLVLTVDGVCSYRATPEVVWGTLHGILGLGFAVWWQATVQMAAMAAQLTKAG